MIWPHPLSYNHAEVSEVDVSFSGAAAVVSPHMPMVVFWLTDKESRCVARHAMHRVCKALTGGPPRAGLPATIPTIDKLELRVQQLGTRLDILRTKESYSLSVTALGGTSVRASVECKTVWGALRGLASFVQVANEELHVVARLPVLVRDAPRKVWRGFMIDTA